MTTRRTRFDVTYIRRSSNRPEHVTVLALTAEEAAAHVAGDAIGPRGTVTVCDVQAAAPRKARKAAPQLGEPAAFRTAGDYCPAQPALGCFGTTPGATTCGACGADLSERPMFETIADFAFAVEVAGAPSLGRLF